MTNEAVEAEKLKTFRGEYVHFMRQALQNKNFDIRTKVLKTVTKSSNKKFIPTKDPMVELSEKYPLVKDLQKILGLRVE